MFLKIDTLQPMEKVQKLSFLCKACEQIRIVVWQWLPVQTIGQLSRMLNVQTNKWQTRNGWKNPGNN